MIAYSILAPAPGTIARGLALRGCHTTGLDLEHHLLTEAARLDREAATGVTYVEGRAEATGLPSQSFDVVTAGQCWHWFDRSDTVREVARILVPGGRLVIAHFDWLPMRDNVVAMTERLIERFNPDWHLGNSSGVYPPWLGDVAEGGFEGLETFSFDVDVPYTHEAWAGADPRQCRRRRVVAGCGGRSFRCHARCRAEGRMAARAIVGAASSLDPEGRVAGLSENTRPDIGPRRQVFARGLSGCHAWLNQP